MSDTPQDEGAWRRLKIPAGMTAEQAQAVLDATIIEPGMHGMDVVEEKPESD